MNDFFMDFRTVPSEKKMKRTDPLLFLGSCFTEEIGGRLGSLFFDVSVNPTGIVFDPLSLQRQIYAALDETAVDSKGIITREGLYYSLFYHSEIYADRREELENHIRKRSEKMGDALLQARWIFITLGTAWVYEYIKTGHTVANCQKVPHNNFQKKILSAHSILEALRAIIIKIRSVNPESVIVFTISPVRHSRDGLWENNVSKGRLHSAVYEVRTEISGIQYFESYEWIMDVLRDYRFYSHDLLHPSAQAIDFIFDRFVDKYLDDEGKDYVLDMKAFKKFRNHRPKSDRGHNSWSEELRRRWKLLCTSYPDIRGKYEPIDI